ncbi:uncharacterized protein LOC133792796 [Humulus lupulus]|uniref:uncharacterized protein LOC133792796 n=1 Tax=Humulus lupulus TaxID=3486 RepID=UPI002B401AB0|nr:uncharacterized protein LOC133792796 [Humulus lupulus]
MTAMVATTDSVNDPPWYSDSGATHHCTTNDHNLTSKVSYNGSEQLHVGDGTGLTISNIGGSDSKSESAFENGGDEFNVPILKNHCQNCLQSIESMKKSENIRGEIIQLAKQVLEMYNVAANEMATLTVVVREMDRRQDVLVHIVEAASNTLEK